MKYNKIIEARTELHAELTELINTRNIIKAAFMATNYGSDPSARKTGLQAAKEVDARIKVVRQMIAAINNFLTDIV